MSDWCLMSADNRRVQRKAILPIGTCVEGIRVEFSTPGYKNTSILAIANIKNSKYQTNVARSAIELDANNEILSDIYDVYKDYVQEQMDRLEDQDYAQSWAVSEERFVRVSNELIEKMWAKIDTQEFVNKILTKNYTLYSIDNWSRKNDSI